MEVGWIYIYYSRFVNINRFVAICTAWAVNATLKIISVTGFATRKIIYETRFPVEVWRICINNPCFMHRNCRVASSTWGTLNTAAKVCSMAWWTVRESIFKLIFSVKVSWCRIRNSIFVNINRLMASCTTRAWDTTCKILSVAWLTLSELIL